MYERFEHQTPERCRKTQRPPGVFCVCHVDLTKVIREVLAQRVSHIVLKRFETPLFLLTFVDMLTFC